MSDEASPQVVAGGGGPKGFRGVPGFLRRHVLQIAGALVLLVLLGGALFFVLHKDKPSVVPKKAPATAKAVKPLKPITVAYEQLNDDQLTTKVNYLMGTKQYTEADKLVSMQTDLKTDPVKLQLLASIQVAEGKTDAAKSTATSIASLPNLPPGQYEVLGDTYAKSGDKAKAKMYYQKAIDGYNAAKVGAYQDTVAEIQAKIQGLG